MFFDVYYNIRNIAGGIMYFLCSERMQQMCPAGAHYE